MLGCQMNVEEDLERLGFRKYGTLAWDRVAKEMRIIPDPDAQALGAQRFSVYAFVIGHTIVRIGKHEAAAKKRIDHRAHVINQWYNDTLPPYDRLSDNEPPLWEAWFETYDCKGSVWCEAALTIAPKLSLFTEPSAHASEILERVEMALIAKFYPAINMETRRQDRLPRSSVI